MKIKTIVSSLVLASALFAANSHHAHHGVSGSISSQIMMSMHEPMMKNPLVQSNDIERDFLANMIPHHQGAIDSSKLLLEHTKSEEMKKSLKISSKLKKKKSKNFKKF